MTIEDDELDLFTAESHADTSTDKPTQTSKYSNKSVDELIAMNEESQKHIGRLGNEVGTLRKLSDQIIELKQAKDPQREKPPVTVESLLNDPDKSLRTVVRDEMEEKARQQSERLDRLELRLTEKDFTSSHKDYAKDLEDPEFKSWVAKSKLKQGLANVAADERNPGRFDAASELWSLWEERKELISQTDDKPKQRKTVANTVRSTPTENHKPRTFSRAKLMELRMKVQDGDPAAMARYNDPEFQTAMIQAYQDGRVK